MEKSVSRIECGPRCGFAIQSEDRSEVVEAARRHIREKHHQEASTERLMSMLDSYIIEYI